MKILHVCVCVCVCAHDRLCAMCALRLTRHQAMLLKHGRFSVTVSNNAKLNPRIPTCQDTQKGVLSGSLPPSAASFSLLFPAKCSV